VDWVCISSENRGQKRNNKRAPVPNVGKRASSEGFGRGGGGKKFTNTKSFLSLRGKGRVGAGVRLKKGED